MKSKKQETEIAAIQEQEKIKQKKKGSAKKIARTVQEAIKIDGLFPDGTILSNKKYSRLYNLTDANFITEPEEKQVDILVNYTKLINRFPDTITISIVIVNRRNTSEDLIKNFHIAEQGDELDELRTDYNAIIDEKITEGNNDISKEKYILLTCKAKSYSEARSAFMTAESSLQEAAKTINKVGVTKLDAITRLSLIKEILCGIKGIPFEKEYARYIETIDDGEGNISFELNKDKMKRAGVSVKDTIAPQFIEKKRNYLQLDENRFCKSYAYINLPTSLDTEFLTASTNLPYEMVTVIQLKSVPRKHALTKIKNQNNSIKADVINAMKAAYKGHYDPSLINEDLQIAREESARLRDDVMRKGKKLFYATMVVTMFADNEDELRKIEEQYKAICGDYTVTPSILYGQQMQGLNTSILVGDSDVIIDRMLTSDNACALFPFNIQELQDKRGHFYGINAKSENMIMYDRKRSRLANGLVFGQSGSGKSFIVKGEIIPNYLDSDDDIIILDPENEYRVIAEMLGGQVIDLELNSEMHINPCDLSMEWGNNKASPLAEKCDYMVGLVEAILGKNRDCNAYDVNVIHRCCNKMYEPYIEEMKRRYKNGDKRDIDTSICPTLRDFYAELMRDGSPEGSRIASAVEQYCIGNYSLFAQHTNIETHNRMTVFNLLYLPEKMKEMAMKVCLSYIWTAIVKNKDENKKNNTSKAVWVYLDEFHLFFQTESSATTIMTYYKRVRKYNGIMTGITQDVADLLASRQGTAMFNNTGFFIFLNQSPIGRNQLQSLYGISDSLIDFIKDKPSGVGLIYNNTVLVPFNYRLPTTSKLYAYMSTNPNDEDAVKKITEKVAVNVHKQLAKSNNGTNESTSDFGVDEAFFSDF